MGFAYDGTKHAYPVMGIAMTMGLKMVTANLNNAAYSETKSKQERIKVALIGFLRTNGKLPCSDNTNGIATGFEVSPCNTNLPQGYGVIPWQTLGITRDAAQDGWGNYFSYCVENGKLTGTAKDWTSKNSGNIHTLYLTPAILLLLMWIATAPSLVAQRGSWEVLGVATVTALVAAWCVTLFVHALRRDKP